MKPSKFVVISITLIFILALTAIGFVIYGMLTNNVSSTGNSKGIVFAAPAGAILFLIASRVNRKNK